MSDAIMRRTVQDEAQNAYNAYGNGYQAALKDVLVIMNT